MAGHLPIAFKGVHKTRVKIALLFKIWEKTPFEKHKLGNGWYQLLTPEYNMNEEHGLVDDLIFAYTPPERDRTYEYHLDKDKNINAVYMVM
jgi:hypothetical protein